MIINTCDEKHFLVDFAVIRRVFGVDVEKSLGVERGPADEKGNHHSNCNQGRRINEREKKGNEAATMR